MNHEIHETHELNGPLNQTILPMEKILFKEECFAIQGAIFEVYREMGSGFLESVYQECLSKEFISRGVPFLEQVMLSLSYKGDKLAQIYKPDFICYDKIILEIKSVKETNDEQRAQLFNYLKATSLRVGLLANFGHFPRATVERIVL
jgi:GxxExxY protein